jgi:hypothetical protein
MTARSAERPSTGKFALMVSATARVARSSGWSRRDPAQIRINFDIHKDDRSEMIRRIIPSNELPYFKTSAANHRQKTTYNRCNSSVSLPEAYPTTGSLDSN